MKRRTILAASIAAAFPFGVHAQEPRQVGIILPYPETDKEIGSRVAAFTSEMMRLGWRHNLVMDIRWATDDLRLIESETSALLAKRPDVVVATGSRAMQILRRLTSQTPVVFTAISDPVGRGLVPNLSRPGGNMTGFAHSEFGVLEKQVEILFELAPRLGRIALVFNPENPSSSKNISSFNSMAKRLGLEPMVAPVRHATELEALLRDQGAEHRLGLVFPSDLTILAERDRVVALASARGIPASYADDAMVVAGGLISYGADRKDLFRRAAGYVDRILRGERPGDLPVQQPTEFITALNMKSATSLQLAVPPALLARVTDIVN